MQKFIGVILIIVASAGIGYQKGIYLSRSLEEMQELQRIFLMLRSEVEYTNTPFREAFFRIGDRTAGKYQRWMFRLAESLNERNGQNFLELWKETLSEYQKETDLDRKNWELLMNMGANMGYADRVMQLGAIDLYLEQLKLHIRQMQEEIPERRRIFNCLGVMGGIFVAVVLV